MYIPEIYKNEDPSDINNFIKTNSFGILINQTKGKIWGTHIPIELENNVMGKPTLQGHISKENPQWESFTDNEEVLAIFSGPHSYISSSWYDHENVPTWNFIAVHVYGKIRILDEAAGLENLKKLVEKYESSSENPVKIENLSKKTMMQTRGIVSFEIEITEIHAQKKLSQNRDDKNHENIITELEKTNTNNSKEIAKEMTKCRWS